MQLTKSIFNPTDNAELIDRLNNLAANMPAVWGKMSAAQMMAHCQASMDMAFGNRPIKRHWTGVIFRTLGKHRLLKRGDLDRHIPTFKDFEITEPRDFDEEKEKFINLIQTALAKGPTALVKYPHPYFSTFKGDEWARLNWKHLDHHLRQFGV